MLSRITSVFTTASSVGVSIRYLSTIIGALLALLGVLGALSPEQVEQLTKMVPELLAAVGAVVAAFIPIYAAITKAFSDKAAEATKQIDAKVPEDVGVQIKTPGGLPDIYVSARGR